MLAMMLMLSVMPVRAENLVTGSAGNTLSATVIASLHHPWAMSFLDENTILVTTKPGQLWLFDRLRGQIAIDGVPTVFAGGQGGLGDVIPHPDFPYNQRIYLSYIDSDDGGVTRYAAVISARLILNPNPVFNRSSDDLEAGSCYIWQRSFFPPACFRAKTIALCRTAFYNLW